MAFIAYNFLNYPILFSGILMRRLLQLFCLSIFSLSLQQVHAAAALFSDGKESEYAARYIQLAHETAAVDTNTSINYFSQGLKFAQSFKQTDAVLDILEGLLQSAKKGQYNPLGQSLFRSILSYIKEHQLSLPQFNKVMLSARRLLALKEYDLALGFYQYCIIELPSNKDNYQLALLLNDIGMIYFLRRQYDAAAPYFEQVINSNDKQPELKLSALTHLALIYQLYNNFESALYLFSDALSVAEKEENTVKILELQLNIAKLYKEWEQPNKALAFFSKALKSMDQAQSLVGQAAILDDIANLELQNGHIAKALKTVNRALELRTKQKLSRARSYINLGEIYIYMRKFNLALEKLQAAERELKLPNDSQEIDFIRNAYFFAKTYYELGEIDKALNSINTCLVRAEAISNSKWRLSALQFKATILQALKRVTEANQVLNLLVELYEQLENRKHERVALEVNSNRNKFRDLEIAQLKKEAVLNKNRVQESEDSVQLLALVVIVLLFTGSFLMYRLFQYRFNYRKLYDKTKDLEKIVGSFEQHNILDPLAKIPNQNAMESYLEREAEISSAYEYNFCVLLIDIDNFAKINVAYSHQIGDMVLSSIANKIVEKKRPEDYFGRWYGADYLYIMHQSDLKSAAIFAEEIKLIIKKTKIEFEYALSQEAVSLTISIGVSSFIESKSDISQCITRAQNALQHGKSYGSDHVSIAAVE